MPGFAEGTPTVTVQLDKPRELGFTIGAMRRANELGVLSVDANDNTAMMLVMPEYIWVCLSDEGREELSVKQIAELLHPQNIKAAMVAIGELFKASLPKEEPGKNGEPAAVEEKPTAGTRRSTSTSSGQLASTTSA